MARGHDVKQAMVVVAIEDHFAVAGGLDGDGLFGRAFERQRHGAVKGRHHGIDVVEAFGAVEAGVDEQRIAGLGAALPDDGPVAEAGAVVGLQDTGEGGLLAGAEVVGRVDVQGAAALVGLGFGAGADLDELRGLAGDAVGVGHHEAALVLGAGGQVQNAAGKAVRDGVVQILFAAIDVFAADAEERHALFPVRFAHGAVLDRNSGVAVFVAGDGPFKAQVQQRRMFNVKLAGLGSVLRERASGGKEE